MPSSILNSDDGVISGTSGLKSSGGDDGVLNIQNNGTTAISVASDGDVGIGTTNPQRKLHIIGDDGAVASFPTIGGKDFFLVENNGNANINIIASTSGNSEVKFTDSGATSTRGVIGYNHADDSLTLATNGAAQAKITSAGLFQFNSGYGSVATAYGCRAWVNFNGSTNALNGSGNVSSITDNGTGDYTINFTSSLPDANYSLSFVGTVPSGASTNSFLIRNDSIFASGSFRAKIRTPGGDTLNDSPAATFIFMR